MYVVIQKRSIFMSIIWKVIKKIGMLIFDVISTAGLYLTQTAREERALKKYTETYNFIISDFLRKN